MKSIVALAMLVCALRAPSQAVPTTVAELVSRADTVVRARVLSIDERGDDGRRITFQTQETLRGDLALHFTITESGAAGCSSSLALLLPGSGVVLCLDTRASSPQLVGSDPRAVLSLEPGVVSHLRALIAAGKDAALLRRNLVSALDGGSPRLRGDAALALARLPQLAGASLLERQVIEHDLRRSLDSPDETTLALIAIAGRLADPALDLLLVESAMRESGTPCTPAILLVLAQRDPTQLTQSIASAVNGAPQRVKRALALCPSLPPSTVDSLCGALSTDSDPSIRRLAIQARAAARSQVATHAFRSIQPRSR